VPFSKTASIDRSPNDSEIYPKNNIFLNSIQRIKIIDYLVDKNKIPKIDKDSKVTEVMKVTKMTPYFSTNMSLCQIEDILKKITNLSEYEKYYDDKNLFIDKCKESKAGDRFDLNNRLVNFNEIPSDLIDEFMNQNWFE
jgi:hypothetical protein